MDLHAPLLTKIIRDKKTAPWFDGEYKRLRLKRRKAEKKWRKYGAPQDKLCFTTLRDECNSLALAKKRNYHQLKFKKSSHSSKSLFKFVDTFLDQDKSTLCLPPSDSLKDTVDSFNEFFQSKIDTIRSKFTQPGQIDVSKEPPTFNGSHRLSDFRAATQDEIKAILKDIEIKTSTVDPIPASLIGENLEPLLPVLTDLVNASLSSGNMDGAKLAHITPLIKGKGLDFSEFKNYRPISNLSFVGKLIERIVLKRLNEHLDQNNLNMPQQSGYKKHHSTETLLVRIVNDLLIASSESKATVVMLLDLSAAFDTVDHNVLLKILKEELGITGTAWRWFKSFLTGRCQKIKVAGEESYEITIRFGVPQGSVLGPVLFNLYIRSLYSHVHKMKFAIQGYADDHQVYKSFKTLDEYTVFIHEVPKCFKQIRKWMNDHFLQLNPGKTEIIVFGSPQLLTQLSMKGIFLDSDICVRLSPVVKNLGFRLDACLNLNNQTSSIKKNCFHKLRQIARMKSFLTRKQMTMLVQAVIMSILDYCNSLYYGCSKSTIKQLQSIQNRACRVIFGMKKQESVDEHLKSLHWLKVNERVKFKILLLTYKAMNGMAPPYIIELLEFNNLSGTRNPTLHIPTVSSQRAFSVSAPRLWNNLPSHLKSCESVEIFKSKLKTLLFKESYN